MKIFEALKNLKTLHLNSNRFLNVPEDLKLVGGSLETFHFADNSVEMFTENSFLGLKVMKRINISNMNSLKKTASKTFSHLDSLEYLNCANNPELIEFDFDSLIHCTNLSHVRYLDKFFLQLKKKLISI